MQGKYKLPPVFVKNCVVYNLHRVREIPSVQGLIVMEGFFDVLELFEQGRENVVAIMGSHLIDEQADLIAHAVGVDGNVILMFDDDEVLCFEDNERFFV